MFAQYLEIWPNFSRSGALSVQPGAGGEAADAFQGGDGTPVRIEGLAPGLAMQEALLAQAEVDLADGLRRGFQLVPGVDGVLQGALRAVDRQVAVRSRRPRSRSLRHRPSLYTFETAVCLTRNTPFKPAGAGRTRSTPPGPPAGPSPRQHQRFEVERPRTARLPRSLHECGHYLDNPGLSSTDRNDLLDNIPDILFAGKKIRRRSGGTAEGLERRRLGRS